MGVQKAAKRVKKTANKAGPQNHASASGGLLSALKVDQAALDTELDSIFKLSAGTAPTILVPEATKVAPKRKTRETIHKEPPPQKKQKFSDSVKLLTHNISVPQSDAKRTTPKSTKLAPTVDSSSVEDDDAAHLEDAYLSRRERQEQSSEKSAPPIQQYSEPEIENVENDGSEGDESESNGEIPVHESLHADGPSKHVRSKKRYVPEGETRDQRDGRTIFIGNLPVEAVKGKSGRKDLQRLITSNVPNSRIESTRFRSIAFEKPTSELANVNDEGSASKKRKQHADLPPPEELSKLSAKQARGRGRAAQWRVQEDLASEQTASSKVLQTPAEKKKVSFIKGDFREGAVSVNAYVVFAHPEPNRPEDAPYVLDPYEAAAQAVEKCDGLQYLGRTLRVDRTGTHGNENRTSSSHRAGLLDNRRTVFVGNLDFESQEENVRAFFEDLLVGEKGSAADVADSDEEDKRMSGTWVKHLRIIRDRDTQLGKGFAYLELRNRDCVDEILAMDEAKLTLNKRILRVTKCKAVTPKNSNASSTSLKTASGTPTKFKSEQSPKSGRVFNPRSTVPKGDQRLGERLKGLDKETRRSIKQSDPDRVARRLAKKKSRNALEREGLKFQGKGGAKAILGKERKKVPKTKAKIPRIRSANGVAKRNLKK